jgi:hypothetical protein
MNQASRQRLLAQMRGKERPHPIPRIGGRSLIVLGIRRIGEGMQRVIAMQLDRLTRARERSRKLVDDGGRNRLILIGEPAGGRR